MQYRQSKQRDLIYKCLQEMNTHASAEAIYQAVNQEANISLATVYRNLAILDSQHLIKKIPLDDGFVYDKTNEPHYHFYCEECHKLYDIDDYDRSLIKALKDNPNIGAIYHHDITISGICKTCQQKKEEH